MRANERMKRRLSGMQATKTKNEKRLSRVQATKNENEILKPVKPEFLKTEFLKVKFRNEFEFKHSFLEFLKAERQALQQVLAKHQQQRQKSRMKGESSCASKYQAGPSVEEVPDSQGGVRQHLLLRRRAGKRNGNCDFYLARKAVWRVDRFLSTVPVSLRVHHQQREVGACKRVGPKAETGRSFQSKELGDTRGRRIRKPVRITVWVRLQAHWPSLAIRSLNSTTPKKSSWASRCSTPRRCTITGVRVLEYGSKNTLIYNLDVPLIYDFLDSLMTESMIVAALGTAETGGRRPIWWTRVVFEHYGVNHTVTELKKRSRVWWKSPFLGSRWTWKSPFLVRSWWTVLKRLRMRSMRSRSRMWRSALLVRR